MKSFVKIAALTLTALTPVSAWAQDAAPAEQNDASADIIVTARKTEERLQDAPTTVAVATAETIDRLGLDNLTDVAKTTPGLVFDDSFGRNSNRPVIRGQANILGSSGVAYFIDGIYYSGSLADYDVDTVERFEVVKGPQSALYGRNTYSGAINLISKRPGDEWTGRVQADISENDRYEATANVRGPIGDSGLGIALGGRYYDNKGEFRNAFDGSRLGKQSTKSAYGLLQYDNGGPFRASLRANYNVTDDGQPAIFATDPNANNCFFDRGNTYRGQGRYFCGTIRPQAVSSDYTREFSDPENVGLEAKTFNGAFRMDFDFTDQLTLTSLTGYNRFVADNKVDANYSAGALPPQIFAYTPGFTTTPPGPPRTRNVTILSFGILDFVNSNHNETKDWSQELRLAYEGERVKLLLGGYYFDQSDRTNDTRVLPANALAIAQSSFNAAAAALCASLSYCASTTPRTILASELPAEPRNINFFEIDNKAVFGSVTFDLTDAFSISAEGRYAEEHITQTTTTFTSATPCTVTATNLCPRVVEKTFKEFTPRVTASYKLAPDNLLYAVYAEGQKPGGFNGNAAIVAGQPTFDPEDNKTIEIGSKNRFLNGALTANLALYHTKVRGYQITQNIFTGTNSVSATRNGGNARVNGAELELLLRPDRTVTVTANYSYVDAKFTSGSDENLGLLFDIADDGLYNCSTGRQFPTLACTPTPSNALYGSIVGKRIPRAPAHTAFVDLDYRTPLGSGDWNVFAGSNVTMTASSFDQVLNLAKTGGSVVVDARLGVQNDRFKIMAYVKNLFDEDAIQQIIRYADANNDLRRNFIAGLRPGRRFGVVLTAGF